MLFNIPTNLRVFIKRSTCYRGAVTGVLFNSNTTTSRSKRRGRSPSTIRRQESCRSLATSPVSCFMLSGIRFPALFPRVFIFANARRRFSREFLGLKVLATTCSRTWSNTGHSPHVGHGQRFETILAGAAAAISVGIVLRDRQLHSLKIFI